MTLEEANALPVEQFVRAFGGVFEHSPWVAEAVAGARPFGSADALHLAMMRAVRVAPREAQLALLRAHPELAGREAAEGALTADSSTEQGRLGFTALGRGELERVAAINQRYRERHGFPCIVALALHEARASVIAEMARRAEATAGDEVAVALEQVACITRARLAKLLTR
jgi:2-oxo-4-hydroxy-4-carboxy-5-ureidoimidazoline decarboxylase